MRADDDDEDAIEFSSLNEKVAAVLFRDRVRAEKAAAKEMQPAQEVDGSVA